MDLYLLAELKTISLKVTTVDMQKPPPDFRTNFEATHPPILIDNGLAILENEKIERHIMKSVPGGHNLFVQDKEVASLIENLYSKLKLVLVRKDEQKSAALRAHLGRIDGLLERRGTRKIFVQNNNRYVSLQALKMKKHEELETPTFTTSIPIDVSENSNAE
ncbi:hypothetical protein HF086_001630 [Spodoptera exigua]|uniref:Uncharacterized protein n=1 Tax=Spodoptera exigua TaxID=7107 RepID=A0A922SKC1_SPOEX|nr:hypothetical protein HF086_001630 [Spodoptera exigua]